MSDEDIKKIGHLISDSEKRLIGLFDQRLEVSEKRIMKEIGDFINDAILPKIADMADKSDIARLESNIERIQRKLDRALDKNIEQDSRLDKLESLPTVVHELKVKKS